MTTMQLNAELFHNLSVIADDESLMKRAVKYLRKLAEQKQAYEDDTLMTKEEFFDEIKESLEQVERGECTRFSDMKEMRAWLNSL